MKKLFSMLILLTFALTLFAQEQQKQMAEFKLNLQKEMIQIDNQLNEKKAQLKTLEQVDKPDMKVIYSKIDEITALQNKKMKVMITHRNNVRTILTAEQRVKFDLNQGKQNQCCKMGQNRRMHMEQGRMHMEQGRMMKMKQGEMKMKQGEMKMKQGEMMKTEQRRIMIKQGEKVIKDTIMVKR